jgi:hypothetical protein
MGHMRTGSARQDALKYDISGLPPRELGTVIARMMK